MTCNTKRTTRPRHRAIRAAVALAAAIAILPAARGADARASDAAQALVARIDAIIGQPRFDHAAWGIEVVSLDSGRQLYAHRAHRLLQPASTAKLFTAALVLDTLGADDRIPTRLLGSGPLRHGRLDGPLILYGMGDPTLGAADATPDWAERLATQLVAHGVRRVHGDLVADDSYFAGPSIGAGWEAGDLQAWYAAPASALSVDENTVTLTVSPGARAGLPARLAFEPADATPPLVDTLDTGAPHSHADINLWRAPGGDTLYAFGSMPSGQPPRHYRLAVTEPARLAGERLRRALAAHGVRVDGSVRTLHWPQRDAALLAQAQPLGEVLSPPLGEILARGLKRSQNLYLQNLLQVAGVRAQADAVAAGEPQAGFTSSADWALRALRQRLQRIGIAPGTVLLQEGSGLSRQDLATPATLVRLLQYLAAQPYAAQLRDALPVAGVDGTLQWRLRDTPAAGNVHAKTGSMTYVDCLAGYVTTAAGEHLAFAIMLNDYHRPDDAPRASADLDAIVELLAGFRG
ncbi:D-alanyl-D-alanine carboxypeptidase/D-alanyl-D-alanine-endopeptidase [Fulvimonas sp. R45]|uniref:D-alanyl-D-alanine carboxypeptidase/D-alanyl-D-alanine endopeptidase n=1 Tax=Fulvimonas sp. R45 TaxID=3045937 RepID=UPI00265E65E1|nr:D-alanyl-D-alanine carboxypeptidase/D-alanyl-D-alanine-endopeptidase [Fulvimonas sp. R45]MDO1530330.1 D-alanyl-D-alanine carboxypeptidase/D-alanyl-D-alanine-endopeptidase [Fulvimonas sp. R45]